MVDSLGKTFHSSYEYDYIDIDGDPDLDGHVPWFDLYAVLTEVLLGEFVQDEGMAAGLKFSRGYSNFELTKTVLLSQ